MQRPKISDNENTERKMITLTDDEKQKYKKQK